MCAIAGILGLPCDTNVTNVMLKTMHRRGPDDRGIFRTPRCCLLHARLAIIDPEGGKQPMQLSWEGETYTIVYNGELYNTEELRNKLIACGHIFLGHCDTEVVLHAFAQWADRCLDLFNGIFSFAVWQEKKQELFLARDRMGVKPLFYMPHAEGFLFASEIKTILTYPTVTAKLDQEGVGEILLLGPGRTPGSGVFQGIYELEPGCCGKLRKGKWSWFRYWKLKDREHRDTFQETVEKVRFLVTDAINRQMVSDVPIGTFLSGGLDSSVISSVCKQKLRSGQLQTFSLDFRNNDRYFVAEKFQPNSDTAYIRIMERYLNSQPHWSVLGAEDLLEVMEEATIARDFPGMADVDFSLLRFCGDIRQHVKVALSGECADEIFGGYPWYRDPEVRRIAGFPWAQNTLQRAEFLHPDIAVNMHAEEFIRARYQKTLNEADILPENSEEERRMKEMVNLNHRWFMQVLLDRKDRMSMYHGLEVRVPFCDYRIAEYLYGIPWEMKDHRGTEKGLLRAAMHDLLPDDILYRKKSPYPKTYDPQYMKLVSNALRELLQQKDAPILGIVNKAKLESLLQEESVWPWYGQLMRTPQTIAFMLQINFWLKAYNVQLV